MVVKKATPKKKPVKKAVVKKVSLINIWSPKDIAYLKANYVAKTATQISAALNRTVNAVRAKAATLHLKKGNAKRTAAKKVVKKGARKC